MPPVEFEPATPWFWGYETPAQYDVQRQLSKKPLKTCAKTLPVFFPVISHLKWLWKVWSHFNTDLVKFVLKSGLIWGTWQYWCRVSCTRLCLMLKTILTNYTEYQWTSNSVTRKRWWRFRWRFWWGWRPSHNWRYQSLCSYRVHFYTVFPSITTCEPGTKIQLFLLLDKWFMIQDKWKIW